jgi:hypothetical protein
LSGLLSSLLWIGFFGFSFFLASFTFFMRRTSARLQEIIRRRAHPLAAAASSFATGALTPTGASSCGRGSVNVQ